MSYKKLLHISKPIDHSTPQDAFNGVLQDLVNLIITNNPTVQVLHKYEFGTEDWNGYPCYADGTRALNYTNSSNFWVQNAPNSDVYILGKDDNNYCMCMAFTRLVKNDQYMLLISCCPGLTANTAIYDKYYNNTVGTYFKNSPSLIAHEIRPSGYYTTHDSIDDLRKRNYKVFLNKDTTNNLLEMNVTYVTSEFGSAYRFGNNVGYEDYYNLLITSNSVGHTVFGITCASYDYKRTYYYSSSTDASWTIHHCIFDFDKPVTIRDDAQELYLKELPSKTASNTPLVDNSYLYPYCWLAGHGSGSSDGHFGQRMQDSPIIDDFHCLNGRRITYSSTLYYGEHSVPESVFGYSSFIDSYSRLTTIPGTWNIPIINIGSAFIRQYYQPMGKGEKLNLWLAYIPQEANTLNYTIRQVGSIFSLSDGRKFIRLLPGLTTPVLRVE